MPRLTPQEKQDIIRFLEADKPLPDKYRFLLFDAKREVELVWNGKTSEVCNLVLPFQVIEQVDEPRTEAVKEYLPLFQMDQRDLLGFEFEMGLFPNVLDEAKSKGIDIQPKYITAPRPPASRSRRRGARSSSRRGRSSRC